MAGSTVRRHVFIRGQVQGVNFRNAMKQVADQLGVVGWVKNIEDGRVEALVEGGPDQIQRILEWCRHGPPAARVDELMVKPEPSGSMLMRFQVMR